MGGVLHRGMDIRCPSDYFSERMTELELKQAIAAAMVKFLNEIGLKVVVAAISERAFLPGIRIERGTMRVDEAKLLYPGDLLHEAGHLAVTPSAERAEMCGNVEEGAGGGVEEMAATAWSCAAAVRLGLDPSVVFRAAGYRGGAESLLENFSAGR